MDDRRRTTDDGRGSMNNRRQIRKVSWSVVPGQWSVVSGRWSAVVAQCLLAAFTLGALAVANSWDLPTYALLLCGALLGRAWRGRRPTMDGQPELALAHTEGDQQSTTDHPPRLWLRLLGALLATGLIVAGALLLYLPFFQNFDAQVGGVGRVRVGTPLPLYVFVYGLFLAVLVPTIFAGVWRLLRHRERLARGTFQGHPAEAMDAQVIGIVAARARLAYGAVGSGYSLFWWSFWCCWWRTGAAGAQP